MKTITTSKSLLTTTLGLAFVLILVALAFVGLFLAQRMQAVNPPPDGVRPGETQPKSRAPCLTPPAAHLTQRLVLFAPDQHSNKFNTAVGAGALFANIADKIIQPLVRERF